jgi:hypothetical protein
MLDPNQRTILFDALRPPEGYVLDQAIGTSYSLDLVALLAAPLGFTLAEWRGNPRDPWSTNDALAVLRNLRRFAGRMSIFCDSARILVPKQHSRLFTLLEETVVPVRAPRPMASFHPKLWVLRYTPSEGDGLPVRYRLLVSSRNLTFDRCMDVIAVLEGEYRERVNGFASSKPIAAFLRKLPELALVHVDDVVLQRVELLAHEIHRTQLLANAPFAADDWVFYALGLDERARPHFSEGRERLIISPFASDSQLQAMTEGDGDFTLISRAEAVANLKSSTRARFDRVLVPRRELLEVEQAADTEEQAELPVSDLHAKVYVEVLDTRATRVTVGSANATVAGFNRNVEVLLALVGPTKTVGPSALLKSSDGSNGFADLWQEYTESTVEPTDPALAAMVERLEAARRVIGAVRWVATVTASTAADRFRIALGAETELDEMALHGVRVRTWPVTLKEVHALSSRNGAFPPIDDLTIGAVSAFWVMELAIQERGAPPPQRFVVRATLRGEPARRVEAVTQSLITDRSALMRYLQLLLTDEDADVILGDMRRRERVDSPLADESDPSFAPWALLEPLLRTLERDPARLEEIERILRDLEATEEGRAKLPPELGAIWPAVWTAKVEVAE